jgi:hypothetical protein
MTPNPQIVKSIEKLDYRVTVGEVAANAGLEINTAQQGLLALAADAGGHLQVAETGDVIYLFPKNFQSVLRNKYWQLRFQEWWGKVWKILFYLIRVSFGIVLIASILLMLAAIAVIIISISASGGDRDDDRGGYGGGGGMIFLPRFWIGPDFFWWFYPDYNSRRRQRRRQTDNNQMNFLESVYSFLFGDGNPNADIEETRYATIGQVIQNNDGAVIAEQMAPYVDKTDADEDYMIPVLARFNGYPEVSPEGEIIYYFPELQVMARKREKRSVPNYLQEQLWRFTQASSTQKILAIGLGGVNIILALALGSFLQDPAIAAELGGLVAFVNSIYPVLVGYGIAFLVIPLIRYFWIQGRNQKIATRNEARESRANILSQAADSLRQKLLFARQFTERKVISDRDLAYTTEDDLLDQNLQNRDKIDAQWQQRLESGSSE